jgi:hypothetical protein
MLRQRINPEPTFRCFVTDDSPKFESIGSRFLGKPIGEPTWIAPDQLTRIEFSSTLIRAVG